MSTPRCASAAKRNPPPLREDTTAALFILNAHEPTTTTTAAADDLVEHLSRLVADVRTARRLLTTVAHLVLIEDRVVARIGSRQSPVTSQPPSPCIAMAVRPTRRRTSKPVRQPSLVEVIAGLKPAASGT